MKEIEQVREFHQKFGHPVKDEKCDISFTRTYNRHKWMEEELDEFLEAVSYIDKVDAMIDLIYLAMGTLVEMGAWNKFSELFNEVHLSNMSKLGLDGKPEYHPDGKIKKGENFFKPDLKKILES